MESQTRFIVTAWRDSQELLQLRQDLYSSETVRREHAVSKVFAWRLRKPDGLPLLLDSTADFVDVVLQDERAELKHNALRLLYATAISRFITGLSDTQIDLTRSRPSFLPPSQSLVLPLPLLQVRHRIVHRHLPSLSELKRAATQSLSWLWEAYWQHLEHAFCLPLPPEDDVEGERESVHGVLKTYIKERKMAIKTRKSGLNAAGNAVERYTLRFGTATPHPRVQAILLDLLVAEKLLLPATKTLQPTSQSQPYSNATMAAAYLIWTPFLLAFCSPLPPSLSSTTTPPTPLLPLPTLLTSLQTALNTPSTPKTIRQAWHDWILYLLSSRDCAALRTKRTVDDVLVKCFSEPGMWNLRLADGVVGCLGEGEGMEGWGEVLGAVREGEGVGGGDDGDGDGAVDMAEIEEEKEEKERGADAHPAPREKIQGPQKVLGMWKPRPIGWLGEGFEEDE
ncbi:hypothetical protein NX059_011061 [Plenodomus lindquistii]|nr:hypothetical protein NX059_011061 [Plenodomus lindquistii]